MYKLCEIDLLRPWLQVCSTKYNNWWLDTLFDWQNPIAAVVAVVPAAIGAWLLWRQVNDQRLEAKRGREQQETAARIKMPHALSQLSDYWKHCFRAIIAGDLSLKVMSIPSDALEVIMVAAPTVDAATFKAIRTLVIQSQIFESRFRSLQSRPSISVRSALIVDLAILDFNTDALYGFARFEQQAVKVEDPDRGALSKQIYSNLDIDERLCAKESNRIIVESALNTQFKKRSIRDL